MVAETPPPLPEVAEPDVVRHFTNLSTENMSVDAHFYPLGSCTMKYNPKRNERLASLPGWLDVHPYQPESSIQGCWNCCSTCSSSWVRSAGCRACRCSRPPEPTASWPR
jgi:glycine dehydrogenase subunit 2